jgi:hypothetical protein
MRSKSGTTTYKVYTNSGNVGFRVGIIRKSEQQTGLSNTGVSNKEQFEEVIAVIVINEEGEQKRLAKSGEIQRCTAKKRLGMTSARSLFLNLINAVKTIVKTFTMNSMLFALRLRLRLEDFKMFIFRVVRFEARSSLITS